MERDGVVTEGKRLPGPWGRDVRFDRVAILAEGSFDVEGAKTAVGVIRYGRCRTVAVIDSQNAGRTAKDVIGVGEHVPVVASLQEALAFDPQTLVIGIAPRGGLLPAEWRQVILNALEAGLDVISGLHAFLSDDPEIAFVAERHRCVVADVRRPPDALPVAEGLCRSLPEQTVLTVGTDCCVGKMSVSLELTLGARRRGIAADFVATGQTGIMIWGRGISVDACVADFIAGAAERMVLEACRESDWVFVEGQGSLYHPGYSGVTMGLLHGTAPKQMVLCHQVSRPEIRGYGIPIPPLNEGVAYHEAVCAPLFPTKVTAIALNTYDLSPAEARRAIGEAEDLTGLPADDCVRNGPDRLLDAVLSAANVPTS